MVWDHAKNMGNLRGRLKEISQMKRQLFIQGFEKKIPSSKIYQSYWVNWFFFIFARNGGNMNVSLLILFFIFVMYTKKGPV